MHGLLEGFRKELSELNLHFNSTILGIIKPKSAFSRVHPAFRKGLNMVSIHQNSHPTHRSNLFRFRCCSLRITWWFSHLLLTGLSYVVMWCIALLATLSAVCFGMISFNSSWVLQCSWEILSLLRGPMSTSAKFLPLLGILPIH